MRKPYQSPGRMNNSSYYIAPVGDRTHDLPHTLASNMVKVSHALNHCAHLLTCSPYSMIFSRTPVCCSRNQCPPILFILETFFFRGLLSEMYSFLPCGYRRCLSTSYYYVYIARFSVVVCNLYHM